MKFCDNMELAELVAFWLDLEGQAAAAQMAADNVATTLHRRMGEGGVSSLTIKGRTVTRGEHGTFTVARTEAI